MAKISKQTKEIINVILFILIVGILVTFYWVYPLGRAKVAMGRINLDEYTALADSLSVRPNEASRWEEAGLSPDTFLVETDGLTTLACLRCQPGDSSKGTVIVLHDDNENRDSVLSLASALVSSGYVVVACDQRASGRSSGKYRSGGWYESSDLNELISTIDLRYRLERPLVAVGFGTGGDAVILSSQNESRLDAVVAVGPYLSSTRLLNNLKEKYDMLWFPFFRTVVWWWYGMRSSYAAMYRHTSDIEAVANPTLLIIPKEDFDDEEVRQIQVLSEDSKLLKLEQTPPDDSELEKSILDFVRTSHVDSASSEN